MISYLLRRMEPRRTRSNAAAQIRKSPGDLVSEDVSGLCVEETLHRARVRLATE